ncbi:hypothetical protein ACHAWF_014631 [Thalassiosira exigua]
MTEVKAAAGTEPSRGGSGGRGPSSADDHRDDRREVGGGSDGRSASSSWDSEEGDSSAPPSSSGSSSRDSDDRSGGDGSDASSDEGSSDGSSRSSRSSRSRGASSEDRDAAAPGRPAPTATAGQYANRTVRGGVLPIVSSGLAPLSSPGGGGSLVRRRRSSKERGEGLPQCRPEDDVDDDEDDGKKRRRGRRRRREGSEAGFFAKYVCCRTSKKSTQILALSFALWVLAQFCYFFRWNLRDMIARDSGGEDSSSDSFGDRDGVRVRKHPPRGHRFDDAREYEAYRKHTAEERERLRAKHREEAKAALGAAAGDDDAQRRGDKPDNPKNARKDRKKNKKSRDRDAQGFGRKERLSDGCEDLDWHSYHFPNCNEVHEVDLRAAVGRGGTGRGRGRKGRANEQGGRGMRKVTPWEAGPTDERGAKRRGANREGEDGEDEDEDGGSMSGRGEGREGPTSPAAPSGPRTGFVGAGLWRDVFACDPRGEGGRRGSASPRSPAPSTAPAVLKVMKSEHDYNARNFHRHRRDALVMERLSTSHHLVAIYGYCADTVLTQAISHTLDDVIYAREHEKVKKWSPRGGYATKPPLESWMGRDPATGELLATRETESGRIKLALGVFRGLVDLHEGDANSRRDGGWLPVVHADLQAKQYLVDATTGRVYLNDFNRCRFVPRRAQERPGLKIVKGKGSRADSAANVTDDPSEATALDPLAGENDPAGNAAAAETAHANGTSTSGGSNSSALQGCTFRIPTAPGSNRSPEEYESLPLTEKLDVYSAGNVLYGILMGEKPWGGERGKHVKSSIVKGERPVVDDEVRGKEGSADWELARLLDRTWEQDPEKRASAREVVEALERLLERELEREGIEEEEGEEDFKEEDLEEHEVEDESEDESGEEEEYELEDESEEEEEEEHEEGSSTDRQIAEEE